MMETVVQPAFGLLVRELHQTASNSLCTVIASQSLRQYVTPCVFEILIEKVQRKQHTCYIQRVPFVTEVSWRVIEGKLVEEHLV